MELGLAMAIRNRQGSRAKPGPSSALQVSNWYHRNVRTDYRGDLVSILLLLPYPLVPPHGTEGQSVLVILLLGRVVLVVSLFFWALQKSAEMNTFTNFPLQ